MNPAGSCAAGCLDLASPSSVQLFSGRIPNLHCPASTWPPVSSLTPPRRRPKSRTRPRRRLPAPDPDASLPPRLALGPCPDHAASPPLARTRPRQPARPRPDADASLQDGVVRLHHVQQGGGYTRERGDCHALVVAQCEEVESWRFGDGSQYIRRERKEADAKLTRSYFIDKPVFPQRYFRRRFWMGIDLFKHIAKSVTLHDKFFEQRRNSAHNLGHSTYQKVTNALRMMAYGIPTDLVDDHLE